MLKLSPPRVKLVSRACFNRDRRAFIDFVSQVSVEGGRINIPDRLKMEETVVGISLHFSAIVSVTNRYALKTHLALSILPRNLQCIRVNLARYEFESLTSDRDRRQPVFH